MMQSEEQGPPVLVLKLAFQFLQWNCDFDAFTSCGEDVDLVCKQWRRLLHEDDVGRQLCINQIKSYDDIVVIRNRNGRVHAEEHGLEFVEEKFYGSKHELLARMMTSPLPKGRTYKDIYKLSKTMGRLLSDHKFYGPDESDTVQGTDKTLREVCLHDCRWIVMPTIEKLREVFDDPEKDRREQDIRNMKQRILSHARKHGRAPFVREDPTCLDSYSRLRLGSYSLALGKDAVTEIAGKYCMMLAVSNSFDENIFNNSSSDVSATLGEIISWIESMTGKEIEAQVSVQLKKTSAGMVREFSFLPSRNEKLKETLHDIDWPMSPVDCLSVLIREYWLTKSEVEVKDDDDCLRDCTEEEWNDAITKWWVALAEPVRQLLLATYAQLAERFDNVEPLPADMKSIEVPTEKVKFLLGLTHRHGRKEVAETIFRDLDPDLSGQLFKIYHQQARAYSEAIRQNYHDSVYSNENTLEYNAKILLDIFLEVPCVDDDIVLPTAPLASENCDELLARMVASMDRWNELVHQVKSDDNVLWNPETAIELRYFYQLWGHTHDKFFNWRERGTVTDTTLQFCVPNMVKAFLCRTLGGNQKLPSYYWTERDGQKYFEELRSGNYDLNSDYISSGMAQRAFDLVNDFRALSIYTNTKEHAMMALVPLLKNLSQFDAKRLIYALFVQRHTSNWWGVGGRENGFSQIHFGSMCTREIPCALGDYVDASLSLEHAPEQFHWSTDLSQLSKWVHDRTYEGFDENSVLRRIFGLPLPVNIISAMGEFMVENLYQDNINDIDGWNWLNALEVKPYLERYCYENPDNAQIVWAYLQRAIENAIMAVEGLGAEDVDERQRSKFKTVALVLATSCIRTRAKSLMTLLIRLRDTQAIVPELMNSFGNLADRFERASSVCIDTKEYFNIPHDDDETL